eukprot:jgi/Psemu1/43355/gm1.43355_g
MATTRIQRERRTVKWDSIQQRNQDDDYIYGTGTRGHLTAIGTSADLVLTSNTPTNPAYSRDRGQLYTFKSTVFTTPEQRDPNQVGSVIYWVHHKGWRSGWRGQNNNTYPSCHFLAHHESESHAMVTPIKVKATVQPAVPPKLDPEVIPSGDTEYALHMPHHAVHSDASNGTVAKQVGKVSLPRLDPKYHPQGTSIPKDYHPLERFDIPGQFAPTKQESYQMPTSLTWTCQISGGIQSMMFSPQSRDSIPLIAGEGKAHNVSFPQFVAALSGKSGIYCPGLSQVHNHTCRQNPFADKMSSTRCIPPQLLLWHRGNPSSHGDIRLGLDPSLATESTIDHFFSYKCAHYPWHIFVMVPEALVNGANITSFPFPMPTPGTGEIVVQFSAVATGNSVRMILNLSGSGLQRSKMWYYLHSLERSSFTEGTTLVTNKPGTETPTRDYNTCDLMIYGCAPRPMNKESKPTEATILNLQIALDNNLRCGHMSGTISVTTGLQVCFKMLLKVFCIRSRDTQALDSTIREAKHDLVVLEKLYISTQRTLRYHPILRSLQQRVVGGLIVGTAGYPTLLSLRLDPSVTDCYANFDVYCGDTMALNIQINMLQTTTPARLKTSLGDMIFSNGDNCIYIQKLNYLPIGYTSYKASIPKIIFETGLSLIAQPSFPNGIISDMHPQQQFSGWDPILVHILA